MNRSVEPDLCGSPWKENRSECQLYPEIFTEEQMAAQLEKMRTMYPDEYQRMLMPKALNKTYKIGMTEKFWVNVDDGYEALLDENPATGMILVVAAEVESVKIM